MKTSDGTELSNVKVIGINSEGSYNLNFFNISNRNDPGGILAWLEDTLNEMEKNNQIGIIISHAPLNDAS